MLLQAFHRIAHQEALSEWSQCQFLCVLGSVGSIYILRTVVNIGIGSGLCQPGIPHSHLES